MTAILGYADGKNVWIGGDSRGLDGWSPMTLCDPKVFRLGDLLIGGSGVAKHLQLLRMTLQLPPQADDEADDHFVCVTVTNAIRTCLKLADTTLDDEAEGVITALMIGYRGVLYYVSSKVCATRAREQVLWLGSGGDLAMGAFEAFRANALSIEGSMLRGLTIAAQYNLTVGAPFYVETL